MSTPFDVRQWASQAGITTTGGFAVVAECVTLEELQRFAQIAMEAAAIDLVKKNNRLDCIARELQDACHKQAQKIVQDEALLRQALAALKAALSDDQPYIEQSKQAVADIKEFLE